MKNVVLVDYDRNQDWDFFRGLENQTKEEWHLECQESSGNHGGVQNLIRYLKYFFFPIHIFRNYYKYSKVVTWQQFHGIILSFYFKFFHIKKEKCPELYVMELIYKPKSGLIGKIYHKFVSYSIESKYITKIFVFSKNEREYCKKLFKLKDEKIEILHLGIEDYYEQYKEKIKDEGYFVSVGRSNRDYEFLLREWPESVPLKIIYDEKKLDIKDHMEQLFKCYREEYHCVLAGCHAVVIPLLDENISCGQLVMLQAMMFGKPVIITENKTVRDYLVDGEDGFIIPRDGEILRDKVRQLQKFEKYKYMTKSTRKHFVELHSLVAMGEAVGKIIKTKK